MSDETKQKFRTPSNDEVNASFSENALTMMRKRYLKKFDDGHQEKPAEMYHRVAQAIADVEKQYGKDETFIAKTKDDFFGIMASKEYTPAGRTLTNAGAGTPMISNCIVLPIQDTLEDIFQTLKDAAILQQAGSGLGFAFSHLRPAGSPTRRTNGMSSGPVEFLRIYNTAFGIIKQQGRHGANMAIMRVDHPDILDFIHCKAHEGEIRNFNISVGITDEFMASVTERPNEMWRATWNGKKIKPHKVLRAPNGAVTGFEEIDITARQLFDELVEGAWRNGEPGMVNLDEANRVNPLPQLGELDATNPCGEQFLHHYDVCNLGSINLSAFVRGASFDWNRLRHVTRTAVRFMDNVVDLCEHPVQAVTTMARSTRRVGLGIMGFADMLYKMGVQYNSSLGRDLGEKVMKFINDEAYRMSQELSKEKGVFPRFEGSVWEKQGIRMRNAALTTVAPTGSISMFTDCSSGVEPNFALYFTKQDKDGVLYKYLNPIFEAALKERGIDLQASGIMAELEKTGSIQALTDLPKELRDTFVVSMDISAEDHIRMQAAFQKRVDNSISKTINFPNAATREDIAQGYILSWKLKCKGMTFYREGSRVLQVLNIGNGEKIVSLTENPNAKRAEGVRETSLHLKMDENRIAPKKRPEVLSGKTYKIKSGYGNLYITVNRDAQGAPFEVFATIGKSGGFFQEQTEAICRLISQLLRAGVKVEEIINDLKGIRGPMPTLTNKGTILSLPDAIGKILEEDVLSNGNGNGNRQSADAPELISEGDKSRIVTYLKEPQAEAVAFKTPAQALAKKKSIADFGMMPGCPECGAVLHLAEGCMSCTSCGFSRCS